MTYRKKLIEVALPLDAINREAVREKSIRHGHPSTLHIWWARRPLAACRAVLFASLVDDPSSRPEEFPTKADQHRERKRLFRLIEQLVKWKNVNDERILEEARAEILKSTDGNLPPMLDPFCGGGSIPLEAQRLGLEAHASDLNPVAVLITKAMIEIPPRFAGQPPVNPDAQNALVQSQMWKDAAGLAEDVRYYGKWMHDEAEKRIGNLYPKAQLLPEHGGGEATVIAWLWARRVKCPNPACGARMPLVRSFWLSTKRGKKVWVEPIVDSMNKRVRFEVKRGDGAPPEGTVDRRGAKCLICKQSVPLEYVRGEGKEGKIGKSLLAIVARGNRQRIFLSSYTETTPGIPASDFLEDVEATEISGYFNPPLYGFRTIGSMFTDRQKLALETFSNLVQETEKLCALDCQSVDYAKAIAVYLTLAVGRLSNRSAFSIWNTERHTIEQTFSEQGVGMVWDFAEANPFSGSTGSWESSLEWIPKCIERFPMGIGIATQRDAAVEFGAPTSALISTDPPYYSSITYADFADFFYGTFRRSLKRGFPQLFATMTTPKAEEAVAAWHRFDNDRSAADEHFRSKLRDAIKVITNHSDEQYPITIYYAFKEKKFDQSGEVFFTAWESILTVLMEGGLRIVHTWPLRTERTAGQKQKKNALASSVVLVCRPRAKEARLATRREFASALRRELPDALHHLQEGNIAPVDLAQAAIGPGMAVFSRYRKVLEADGNPMRVRTALQIINGELDAYFAEQEGDLDADTRFCTAWFEQHGMDAAAFGEADVLARAKNSSVEGIKESGVLLDPAGKVRLVSRDEYPNDWDPTSDSRLNTWKCTQYLIRALDQGGETEAALLVNLLGGGPSEAARGLAYRLYTICERKGWAQEAVAYNTLVTSWSHIQSATTSSEAAPPQRDLF